MLLLLYLNLAIPMAAVAQYEFSCSLGEGWNFVSIPVGLSETDIATVLQPIASQCRSVWRWVNDPAEPGGGYWLMYAPNVPWPSDLYNFGNGPGFWMDMTAPAVLNVNGQDVSDQAIQLDTGWEQVGYNGRFALPVDQAFLSIANCFSRVWTWVNNPAEPGGGHWLMYDPNAPLLSDLTTIEPGMGLSIEVTSPCSWTIYVVEDTPMALIPAGEFQMGDSVDEISWALPVHTVYLDAFYMDVYEVTNAQYQKFMDATGHSAPVNYGDNFNAPEQPVVGANWYDAVAYATWAGKRLPTEAEWEKAARGGLAGKRYPWGDDISHDDANYYGTGGADVWYDTSPVGSFAPNGYGLYDMAGNVWEWCADWYDGSYYANSPLNNPLGPDSGSGRVLRGGSWCAAPSSLRAADRYGRLPTFTFFTVGFRCVSQD